VTTRLSINELRSARSRRERYVGEWLPEPIITDAHCSIRRRGSPPVAADAGLLERQGRSERLSASRTQRRALAARQCPGSAISGQGPAPHRRTDSNHRKLRNAPPRRQPLPSEKASPIEPPPRGKGLHTALLDRTGALPHVP
jgi:hypothetical protein